MTPQHMIEHVLIALQISNGKRTTECFNSKEKLPMFKSHLLSNSPLPKGFVTPYIGEGLLPLRFPNIDEAKSELERKVNDYSYYFEKNPESKLVNVTFGELYKDEWVAIHDKHFAPHLTQFGLIV